MDILRIPAAGLDDIAIEPGQITVIAADRQSGKSTFAAQLAQAWSPDLKVALCTHYRGVLPNDAKCAAYDVMFQYSYEIDEFSRKMLTLRPDVIILDEIYLAPRNPRFPASSDVFSLEALAERLRIPIVCVISRNPLVDALLAATTVHLFDNELPEIGKEARA